MELACLKMGGYVHLKLWVKLGCSPRYTKIVPEWPLASQLVPSDQIWAFSLCLSIGPNACLLMFAIARVCVRVRACFKCWGGQRPIKVLDAV